MRWSLGGHRACCNPFRNKPFHALSPVATSLKTLFSEIKCARGCHYFYFPLLPGKKGLVFAEASQPCPQGLGGCVCWGEGGSVPPPSRLRPLPAAGIALPALPRLQLLMVAAAARAVPPSAPRRASAPRPLPLSLPGTAAEAPPQREAHTSHSGPPLLWSVTLGGSSGSFLAPSRSPTPGAGGSGSAGSRERPAAQPRR